MTGQLITDAVQTGETVVTGAVLMFGVLSMVAAVLFLGSLYLAFRFVTRHRRAAQPYRDERPAVSPAQPAPQPAVAVLDLEPGADLGLRDECELIFGMPAREPGLDRLRWAIRDEQKKGDQS
ncbi:hypothetical protein AB0N17_03325 [Streptomyces sp. NPDC051133]|uniref:hypothetical protein n=1 Tax=Streptomyces sp. NPDC051133 TaxID=3155521 RepID=UPI00341E81D5